MDKNIKAPIQVDREMKCLFHNKHELSWRVNLSKMLKNTVICRDGVPKYKAKFYECHRMHTVLALVYNY